MLIKLLGFLWTWLYHSLKDIISVEMIAILCLLKRKPVKCIWTKGLLWRILPCLFSDLGILIVQLKRDKAWSREKEPTQFGAPRKMNESQSCWKWKLSQLRAMRVVFPHCKFDIIKIDLLFGARWHAILLKWNPALWQWPPPTRNHLGCDAKRFSSLWALFTEQALLNLSQCKDASTALVHNVTIVLLGYLLCLLFICLVLVWKRNNEEHMDSNLGTDHPSAGCFTTCFGCPFSEGFINWLSEWVACPFIQQSLQCHTSKTTGSRFERSLLGSSRHGC